MKIISIMFLLALVVLPEGEASLHRELGVPKSQDKRYATFKEFFSLGVQRGARTLVETGTARAGTALLEGDGASTCLFARWCKKHNIYLYSVDIDPVAIIRSRRYAKKYNPNVIFFTQNSIEFLNNFPYTIDLLYMDSFDFDVRNPGLSQEHHLNEIKAAMNKLHDNSVILIDDCDLPYGGKGKLVEAFLIERGWKIWRKEYQTLLVKHI